MANQCKEHNA